MSNIAITNVINISVALPPSGLAPYSINNLLCITDETPVEALGGDYKSYASAADVAADWGSSSETYKAAQAVFSQSPNILTGGGVFIVMPLLVAETTVDAMIRAKGLVYFGGVATTYDPADDTELQADATQAQTMRKLYFYSVSDTAKIAPSGVVDLIRQASQIYARGMYHGDSAQAYAMKWAYASRGMSVNFSGTNTTITMNLKSLVGVVSDTTLNQTLVDQADASGAEVYGNVSGLAVLLTSGANEFYDNVYNLTWFVGALEVSGFNYLRQTATKIPQTESGMDGLKGSYRTVCDQAVVNRFVGAGTWTSPDKFGNPEDFDRNISDFGYFIYSLPLAKQLPADRSLRKAPLTQIAIKYQGAIHSSDVLINVNA